jgi:hypothetical protein
MSELKPCPFCGKSDMLKIKETKSAPILTFISCNRCGGDVCQDDERDVWNRRPIEDGLRSEVARLKARLGEAEEIVHYLRQAETMASFDCLREDARDYFAKGENDGK